jgi:hypothetical protein
MHRFVRLIAIALAACDKRDPAVSSASSPAPPGSAWVDSGVTAVAFSSTRFHVRHVVLGVSAELVLIDPTSRDSVLDRVRLAAPDSAMFAHEGCREQQRPDALLVGLVRYGGTPRLEAFAAWRVDTLRGKLVAVDHAKVTCVNENYGV